MKTRGRKLLSQENVHDENSSKIVLKGRSRKLSEIPPPLEVSQTVGKRAALREKTNINRSVLSIVDSNEIDEGKSRKTASPRCSPRQTAVSRKKIVPQKETYRASKTPSPRESSFRREVRERGISKRSELVSKESAPIRETYRASKTPSPRESSFKREVRERGISKRTKLVSKESAPLKETAVTAKSPYSKENSLRELRVVVEKLEENSSKCNASLSDLNNSTSTNTSTRRKCVYMNAIPEDKVVKDKEVLYEFVVDKNEPPSKRRRKRTVRNGRKGSGFPRRRNNSESSCSSVSSHFSTLSSSTASSILKPVRNGNARKRNQVVSFSNSISSISSSVAGIKPPATDDPVPDSFLVPKCRPLPVSNSSIPSTSSVVEASTAKGDLTVSVNNSICPPSIECPSVESSAFDHVPNDSVTNGPPTPAQNPNPPETPTKNCLSNSSIWSEKPSMSLGLANLHSTPCKARSGSDTSSFQHLDESNCNKENCFGFSSDEEEEEIHMISPVRMSPGSHVHRHTILSPPKIPSRFSPHTMRRMLVSKEDSNASNVNNSSNHRRKLQFQEKKKQEPLKKVVRRAPKKIKPQFKDSIISSFMAAEVKETSGELIPITPSHPVESPKKSLSPIAEGLFEDLEDKGTEALTIRPPRRSYERPLRKNKKVTGGGLYIVSDEEDDPLEEGENLEKQKEVVVEKKKPQVHHPRKKKTEKELDQWASLMNMQFGEVEGFDLCIDK